MAHSTESPQPSSIDYQDLAQQAVERKQSKKSYIGSKIYTFFYTPLGWSRKSPQEKANIIFNKIRAVSSDPKMTEHCLHLLTAADATTLALFKNKIGVNLTPEEETATVQGLLGFELLKQHGKSVQHNIFDSIEAIKENAIKEGKNYTDKDIAPLVTFYAKAEECSEDALSNPGNPYENLKTILKANLLPPLGDLFTKVWIGKNSDKVIERIVNDAADHFSKKNFLMHLGSKGWNGKQNIFEFCDSHNISSGYNALQAQLADIYFREPQNFQQSAKDFLNSKTNSIKDENPTLWKFYHLNNPATQVKVLEDAEAHFSKKALEKKC